MAGEHLCEQSDDEEQEAHGEPAIAPTTVVRMVAGVLEKDPAQTESEQTPKLHSPEIIFDRYHVMATASAAVDEVR